MLVAALTLRTTCGAAATAEPVTGPQATRPAGGTVADPERLASVERLTNEARSRWFSPASSAMQRSKSSMRRCKSVVSLSLFSLKL